MRRLRESDSRTKREKGGTEDDKFGDQAEPSSSSSLIRDRPRGGCFLGLAGNRL